MIIVIDIGNSRMKWGFYTNRQLHVAGSIDYKNQPLDVILSSITSNGDLKEVIISNVAGQSITDAINSWYALEKRSFKLHFASSTQRHTSGLVNAYRQPAQLGVDRWVGMVCAWMIYQSAFCLIDCGTAMTVDAVNSSGEHLGGLIIPGMGLMKSLLENHTAGCKVLPSEEEAFSSLLARDTEHALQAGALFSSVAFIERIVEELKLEMGQDLLCIMTGGASKDLLPLLSEGYIYQPNLVLQGLATGFVSFFEKELHLGINI